METCVRGFSYMPENKIEVTDLQYIEGGELERTWKATRRQRIKHQEQKIWEEFVKEQDIVKKAEQDDPYQFLHELPETSLKELMESELTKMALDKEKVANVQEQTKQGEGDQSPERLTVTFTEEADKPECNIFHIFDDDDANDDYVSGQEDEYCPESPSTVRENSAPSSPPLIEKAKSAENVTSLIENSIYCARVKDIRININEEMQEIMASLDICDAMHLTKVELSRHSRRSVEFSARYNRIYMYQLQRQMSDIQRNLTRSAPFAQHTHFQSQMTRVVSLHQNTLQAVQIFRKSFPLTPRSHRVTALRGVVRALRDISALCRALPAPKDLAAATLLYDDELPVTCEKLEEVFKLEDEATQKEEDNLAKTDASSSRKSRNKSAKKRSVTTGGGYASSRDTDTRLSMYSLDTLRLNTKSSKENQTKISKSRMAPNPSGPTKTDKEKTLGGSKATPKSRRPLMRAPATSRPRPKMSRDTDVPTMVEAVATCPSSHLSYEISPRPNLRSPSKTPFISPRCRQRNPLYLKKMATIISESRCSTARSNPVLSPLKLNTYKNEDKVTPNTPKVEPETVQNTTPIWFNDDIHFINEGRHENYEKNGAQCSNIGNPGKEEGYTGTECKFGGDLDLDSEVGKKTEDTDRRERERDRATEMAPSRCDVTKLLRELCSGDTGSRSEKVFGAKNAQLLCISSSTTRQPSTPQLLRILEETIQKQAPKPFYKRPAKDPERYRLTFNISETVTDHMLEYRTKFVQHMLSSPMYANSEVGKPWEMIGSVSEKIIDEVLINCAKEMQVKDIINDLYRVETN